MKRLILFSILELCLFSCSSSESKLNVLNKDKNVNTIIDSIPSQLYSGRFGNVSLANYKDTLTGIYEYYDKWDESSKSYLDLNLIYFFGLFKGNNISIQAGWPGNPILSGKLNFSDQVIIKLKDQPEGYAAVDFVKGGYSSKRTSSEKWKRIAVIRAEKSYLHSHPSGEKTKVYLIEEDIVKILDINGNWLFIEYSPPSNQSKKYFGWIAKNEIYDVNPSNWK